MIWSELISTPPTSHKRRVAGARTLAPADQMVLLRGLISGRLNLIQMLQHAVKAPRVPRDVEEGLPERVSHVGWHEVAGRDQQSLGAVGDLGRALEDRVLVGEGLDGPKRAA